MKRVLGLLVFCFITVSGAYAGKVINLATITSDADEDTAYFKLQLDDKSDISALVKEKYGPQKNLIENKFWKAKENIGDILFAANGSHKVVIMRSPNFATQNGGDIQLDLLYQGKLIGTDERWKSPFTLKLVREGDEWFLQKNGVKVTHLYFKANHGPFNKVVGIEEVLINRVRASKK